MMAREELRDDYYEILELHQVATFDQIKQNYRRLALLLHPDKNSEKPDATVSFQRLNEAYETLKDERSQLVYDREWPMIVEACRMARIQAERDAGLVRDQDFNADMTRSSVTFKAELAKARIGLAESPAANAAAVRAAVARALSDRLAEEKNDINTQFFMGKPMLESFKLKREHFKVGLFELELLIKKIELELNTIQTMENQTLKESDPDISTATWEGKAEHNKLHESRSAKQQDLVIYRTRRQLWHLQVCNLENSIASEKAKMRLETQNRRMAEKFKKWQANRVVKRADAEESVPTNWRDSKLAESEKMSGAGAWEPINRTKEGGEFVGDNKFPLSQAAWTPSEEPEVADKRDKKEHKARKAAWKLRTKNTTHEEWLQQEDQDQKVRLEHDIQEREKVTKRPSCSHIDNWLLVDELHKIGFCQHCRIQNRRAITECPVCSTRACHRCRDILKYAGGAGKG